MFYYVFLYSQKHNPIFILYSIEGRRVLNIFGLTLCPLAPSALEAFQHAQKLPFNVTRHYGYPSNIAGLLSFSHDNF